MAQFLCFVAILDCIKHLKRVFEFDFAAINIDFMNWWHKAESQKDYGDNSIKNSYHALGHFI